MEKVLAKTTDCYGDETPIAILTQRDGQMYLWEIVCYGSYDHNLGHCLCVNHAATDEYPVSTNEVIQRFGIEALDGFEAPEIGQLCFDAFGIEVDELETFLRVSYMLGENPLPALRRKTSADIVFAENAHGLAFPDAEPGTIIFVTNSRGEISVIVI